jgi:hypothetical protein
MKFRRGMLGLLLLAAFISTSAFSCSKHQVVVAEHDFKVGVQAAQTIELNEFKAGNISPAFHQEFESTIFKVAQVGEQVSKDLAANASNTTIVAELSTIAASLQTLVNDGAIGVKNPTTQANLNTVLQAAIALVQNLETSLGGKI